MIFAVYKNLKSSFLEDNMLVHFIKEKRNQTGFDHPIKHNKWVSNLRVAPTFCIFLYNAMETLGVRQGISIMHSNVMDTLFHNGDILDCMP